MIKTLALYAAAATALVACAGTPDELAANQREECRSIEVTGSKFPKKECRTVEDWAQYDEDEKARNKGLLDNARQGVQP
jgi:hypothetical protein